MNTTTEQQKALANLGEAIAHCHLAINSEGLTAFDIVSARMLAGSLNDVVEALDDLVVQ